MVTKAVAARLAKLSDDVLLEELNRRGFLANLGAAVTGNHLQALEALRDELAYAVDTAPVTVVAQVASRYQSVLAEVAVVKGEAPETGESDGSNAGKGGGGAGGVVIDAAGRWAQRVGTTNPAPST